MFLVLCLVLSYAPLTVSADENGAENGTEIPDYKTLTDEETTEESTSADLPLQDTTTITSQETEPYGVDPEDTVTLTEADISDDETLSTDDETMIGVQSRKQFFIGNTAGTGPRWFFP